jgi:GH24 family phage-related lysozyme (muramidase)
MASPPLSPPASVRWSCAPDCSAPVNVERVIALLRDLEGWREFVYDDKSPWPRTEVVRLDCREVGGQYKVNATGGTATVGYGETSADFIDRFWGRRITQAEALEKMGERVEGFYRGVRECIAADLTKHQWEAVTCRAYQTGAGGFCRSIVAQALNEGDIETALTAWRRTFAHPDRSEIEIAHFLTPDAGEPEEPMTPADIIRAAMDDLEAEGFDVEFEDGWEDRTVGGTFAPAGFLWHHTATSASAKGDYPSRGIVRDGVDQGGGYFLPGPLSQFGGGRAGTIIVIAAGKANHAGPGGWNGLVGNGSVWGLEMENNGIGEPWRPRQVEAGVALAAALGRHGGFGAESCCRHAEWSTAGKIDPATPPMNDGDWLRAQVAARLGSTPNPQPQGELAMLTFRYIFDGLDWVFDGPSKLFFQLNDELQITEVLDPLGMKALGKVSDATHRRYSEVAAAAGFSG